MEDILTFIHNNKHIATEVPAMESDLQYSIAYQQTVGELLNQAVLEYKLFYAEKLSELEQLNDLTETIRKARLEAWTAEKKRSVDDLKLCKGTLRSIQMSLMQAIKTRREEPFTR